MTNVIPLKPNGEGLNPTQVIDRLHELCEKLQQVKRMLSILQMVDRLAETVSRGKDYEVRQNQKHQHVPPWQK